MNAQYHHSALWKNSLQRLGSSDAIHLRHLEIHQYHVWAKFLHERQCLFPIDRRYYTLWVLERLHEALLRHDVFMEESTR